MIEKKIIGKLPVLLGEYDSTKTYSKRQRVTLYGSEFESKVDNNTVAPATLSNGNLTINTNNWIIVSNGTEAFLAGEKVKHFNEEDNPEFVSADTDNDGRLLESTDVEGKKTFYGDVTINGNVTSKAIDSKINDATEKAVENKIDKVDGKSLIDENIANSLSEEDNPEYMAVNLDVDNKVVDSTDMNGVVTHNTKHIFKNGIEDTTGGLKKEALQYTIDNSSDLAKALKDGGYLFSSTDWSDYISNDGDNPLHLPEPRCAIINLITSNDIDLTQINKAANVSNSFKGKKFDIPVEVQYWDKEGNYFRKKAYISGQGDSSINDIKKNIAFDFFDSDFEGDDFSIKFGNQVAQSSYHAKSFYKDFIRGASVIAYKIADIVEDYADKWENKPWKRALIDSDGVQLNYNTHSSIEKLDCQFDTGALCHPTGFPAIIYQNGSFFGIYAFLLKKHRDNYHMSKSNPNHIHLDGELGGLLIGSIDWKLFEIRNPKDLYYKEAQTDKNGNKTFKYDADIAQAEIAGNEEINAWIKAGQLPDGTNITSKIQKNLENTANVKNSIIALSKYDSEIKALSTENEKRLLAEKYFDLQSIIDYEITNLIVCDTDGFWKNWQWITYDGVKWSVCEYDKDMSFGNDLGAFVKEPWGMTGFNHGGSIFNTLLPLVADDCLKKVKSMIKDGTLSSDRFITILLDWINRIGYNNYKKEYEKWSNSPCNRDDGVDNNEWRREGTYIYNPYNSSNHYSLNELVINDKVYQSLKDNNTDELTNSDSWKNVSYIEGKSYKKDDVCYIVPTVKGRAYKFVAIRETSVAPTTNIGLGYKDNIWRFIKFIKTQVDNIINWSNAQN